MKAEVTKDILYHKLEMIDELIAEMRDVVHKMDDSESKLQFGISDIEVPVINMERHLEEELK